MALDPMMQVLVAREPIAQPASTACASPAAFEVRRWTSALALASRERLVEIFRAAVLADGPRRYTAAQVAAWAAGADDVVRQTEWLRDGATWVAVAADRPDRPLGVASLHPSDHVHWLYVDPAFQRRGIARALLRALEDEAGAAGVGSLSVDASLNAHPVFLARGFEVVAREAAVHRGETFRRARMRKVLR